jgi:hypothetical protein
LYDKYAGLGYTCVYIGDKITEIEDKEIRGCLIYWTLKGRYFIYEYLKNIGILPVLERNLAG